MSSTQLHLRRLPGLLLGLAMLAAPAAQAAAPGAEVCDRPLPAGSGDTATAIVRTACLEHKAWFQPFIDSNGRMASIEVTEAERTRLRDDTPAWQRVARYWRESGTLSSMIHIAGARSCMYPGQGRETDSDCRAYIVDNPWSAAFVSWVMTRASVPGFAGSPRHVDYITRAWRDPAASPYLHADPFLASAAPGDLLCYLRETGQALGPEGLRGLLAGNGQPMPQRSHCDIVVAANVDDDRTLYLIGGNVFDAVTMRLLPLDAEGRLLASEVRLPVRTVPAAASPDPAPAKAGRKNAARARKAARAGRADTTTAAAAVAPGAMPGEQAATASAGAAGGDPGQASGDCRPGNQAACSFNRRDWVVLLRLKPQAQLRSGEPIPASPE